MQWIVVTETQVHTGILWEPREGAADQVPPEAAYEMEIRTQDIY